MCNGAWRRPTEKGASPAQEARQLLLELEVWLWTKNESAANSLLKAFDELLTLHRRKVPAPPRKTLMPTNPTERMF
jgi:hypothetical protein